MLIEFELPTAVVHPVVMLTAQRAQLRERRALKPVPRGQMMDLTSIEPHRAPRHRTRPIHRP